MVFARRCSTVKIQSEFLKLPSSLEPKQGSANSMMIVKAGKRASLAFEALYITAVKVGLVLS